MATVKFTRKICVGFN